MNLILNLLFYLPFNDFSCSKFVVPNSTGQYNALEGSEPVPTRDWSKLNAAVVRLVKGVHDNQG